MYRAVVDVSTQRTHVELLTKYIRSWGRYPKNQQESIGRTTVKYVQRPSAMTFTSCIGRNLLLFSKRTASYLWSWRLHLTPNPAEESAPYAYQNRGLQ